MLGKPSNSSKNVTHPEWTSKGQAQSVAGCSVCDLDTVTAFSLDFHYPG